MHEVFFDYFYIFVTVKQLTGLFDESAFAPHFLYNCPFGAGVLTT